MWGISFNDYRNMEILDKFSKGISYSRLAEEFDLSRERIRGIVANGVRKLLKEHRRARFIKEVQQCQKTIS